MENMEHPLIVIQSDFCFFVDFHFLIADLSFVCSLSLSPCPFLSRIVIAAAVVQYSTFHWAIRIHSQFVIIIVMLFQIYSQTKQII